jgi:hypothetical protein
MNLKRSPDHINGYESCSMTAIMPLHYQLCYYLNLHYQRNNALASSMAILCELALPTAIMPLHYQRQYYVNLNNQLQHIYMNLALPTAVVALQLVAFTKRSHHSRNTSALASVGHDVRNWYGSRYHVGSGRCDEDSGPCYCPSSFWRPCSRRERRRS